MNKLDAEARDGRQGRTADLLCRLDFVVLDELGYLPFAQTGGQLVRRGNGPPDRFLLRLGLGALAENPGRALQKLVTPLLDLVGWISKSCASSISVFSPLIAATATFALNAGL